MFTSMVEITRGQLSLILQVVYTTMTNTTATTTMMTNNNNNIKANLHVSQSFTVTKLGHIFVVFLVS